MLIASRILPALLVKPEKVIDTLTLPHDERHKRKFVFNCENGTQFLLDLEKAHHLKSGEGCLLSDGGVILIKAAFEECLELTSENPARLLKLAWHIGNRHTPAEISESAIYIAYDHVLEQMVRGLGVNIARVTRQFQPEQGAYHQH
jgi:urease accessory protein